MVLKKDFNLVCEVCGSFVKHGEGDFPGQNVLVFACSNENCDHSIPESRNTRDYPELPDWVVLNYELNDGHVCCEE